MYNHYGPCTIHHQVAASLPLLAWLILGLIPPKSVLGQSLHMLHVVQAIVHWGVLSKNYLYGTAQLSSIVLRKYFFLCVAAEALRNASDKFKNYCLGTDSQYNY